MPTLNQPVKYTVAKVEEKKRLDTGAIIYKLGLVEANGEKLWPVEAFNPKPPPTEGSTETLIITDSEYGLKAKRPSQGGGGGRRPSDPEERKSIEAQVAAKLANEWAIAQLHASSGQTVLTGEQIAQATKDRMQAILEAKKLS